MHSVTPEVLAKVAKLLGWVSLWHDDGTKCVWVRYANGQNEYVIADGELLLAILNKAAEMELLVNLKKPGFSRTIGWYAEVEQYKWDGVGGRTKIGTGETPLDAVSTAFAQLETTHG
jgi:hypothetical protein